MWSDGGVEGLKEPLFGGGAAPREAARHLWGSSSRLLDQTPDDRVSSSTSPSQLEAAVDLSLKSQVESSGAVLEGRRPSVQSASAEKVMVKGKADPGGQRELRRPSGEEEAGGRLLAVGEPPPVPESSGSPPPPTHSSIGAQTDQREYTSIKEVLLEMTNRKNGHPKLPPAKWGIMKKDADQVLLKVPKYIVDEKKGVFPRPTALVNPFPADISPPNGSATHQTSIKDWLHGSKELSTREMNKACAVSRMPRAVNRHKLKGANGRYMNTRKKPLTTIVEQLAGTIQCSQSLQTDPGILQTLLAPSESVSFSSSHRLSGGEVSISELTPDISVVDRLKKLGTVIELEDKAENNSLKLLEKMTKSVTTDVVRPKTPNHQIPSKVMLTSKPLPQSIQQNIKQLEQSSRKNNSLKNQSIHPPINHHVIPQAPKINLSQVPSERTHALQPEENQSVKGGPTSTSGSQQSIQIPSPQNCPINQPATTSNPSTYQAHASSVSSKPPPPSVSPKVQSSMQATKTSPISLTPKVVLSVQKKKSNSTKTKSLAKPPNSKQNNGNQTAITHLPTMLSDKPSVIPVSAIGTTLYISKDVTLIPKLPLEQAVHERIEPALLEPVIDIVEEENILSQDGTFLFKTDSFFSVDLPNEQKVFSCDICSAVYTHSNMLRRHYLRLHISRQYISEKDMETFNIGPEPVGEQSKEKLVFRCHTCRECFPTKNDLRSHLTDHPPVVDSGKQNNKSHPTYKCKNCSSIFKWRKQFGKHKKSCKPSPPPPSEKPDLFHCLYCNETFSNANMKRNHILSYHPYVRRKHCCVFCKRDGFPTNVSLFLHLLNDHSTVYFACQVCKERFTTLEDLKLHTDKRHDQDDKLKSSLSERVSTLKQEKDYYSCETCQRKFLIEASFKEHVCFPEKQEKPKPKLQKIKKKVYPLSERLEKSGNKNIDLETLFYSRVAGNVRDNLLHHLDGKIHNDVPSEQDEASGAPSPNVSTRTFLNFSAGFPSSSEIQMDQLGSDTPTRVKAPWEKYTFPKNYDGRCGLTSYIKDTSYLDISTQLIMRRNLQRLNMLPMKESPPDDVPSVLALERLGAECAESFGQLKKEKKEDDGEDPQELGSLSGEWVRERMYVCSACRWESPCLWTMEDHKYLAHPRVHCPQHELIGDQTSLSKTIYKRLVTEVPNPFKGPTPPSPPVLLNISCTKCSKTGFSSQTELHIHILECAGEVVEAIGPIGSTRRKRRRTRRRPRRGLKRNIPSTPQKLPPKQRTKPGDTDTIQRMIANLPAKRISRKVFSAYDEDKARQNIHKTVSVKGGKNKKSPGGKRSQSEPPNTPIKEEQPEQVILQSPTVIKKEQDYIDTSAEGGDVLSSLRMMPVRSMKTINGLVSNINSADKKDVPPLGSSDDKEMPKLEIEKDISPVESTEIPVLSPVENKDEVKKEKDDLICGISFVDGVIKYETISSVSQETEKLVDVQTNLRKRKSSASGPSPRAKKTCKSKDESQNNVNHIVKDEVVSESPQKAIVPQVQSGSNKRSSSKESIKKKDVKAKSDAVPKEIIAKSGTSPKETTSTKAISRKKSISKKNSLSKDIPVEEDSPTKENDPTKNNVSKNNIIKKASSPKKSIGKKKASLKGNASKKNDSPKEEILEEEKVKDEIIKEEAIKQEEKELELEPDTKDISLKRRGRPKGSLTRKSNGTETKRRSNRRSVKNDTTEMKFDEILPFEEEEVKVSKPEKPKRKPRTVKEIEPETDLTTIVVQAEIHPPPVLKRKVAEIYTPEVSDLEVGLSAKKTKESESPVNISQNKNDIVNTDVIASECIVEKDNPCEPDELTISLENHLEQNDVVLTSSENVSKAEPDTSVMDEQDCIDINQEYEVSEKTTTVESEEAIVTTSVSDNQLEITKQENQEINNYENSEIKIEEVEENLIEMPLNENVTCEKDSVENNCCNESVENTISLNSELIVANDKNSGESNLCDEEQIATVACEAKESDNQSEENNTIILENEEAITTASLEDKQPTKKKKALKKVIMKTKKKKKEEPRIEETSVQDEKDKRSDKISSEKGVEVDKAKKTKKHPKKESSDLSDAKKLKNNIKRKKVIKKIVKMKKRFSNKLLQDTPTGEVLNIAGFKWEVSAFESLPIVDSSVVEPDEPLHFLPDSSVEEPLPEQGPEPLSSNVPDEVIPSPPPPKASGMHHQQYSSSAEVVPPAGPPTSVAPPPSAAPASQPPSAHLQSWETAAPWEAPTPDPSLGTIIDSVNKLLNEPESAYSPLGLPSYSLADLQKAMGASDDEMAVLQQLGEASLQITTSDGSCSGSVKGSESDDWNGEKCIMDLDSQSTLQKQSESTMVLPEPSQDPPEAAKEIPQEWRWRDKTPSVGSSSLLEAHQGKEVLCPSCSCHFMGFPALQRHLVKAHPSVGPKSKKRGAGTPFTKTDLNRRMPLDSSQSPRLVCFTCQQILPADRMSLHLEQEHGISPEEVSKCSSLSGESHDGPVIGERLKSKMSSKLGDLLDRAVNNLLQAKHKPNNTLSGGAVELLTKLCAVRKREGSVKHRLQGARELLSKLQKQQDQKPFDEIAEDSTKTLKPAKLFSCSICGLKFSLPSSRNKHEVLAHRSFNRPVEYEMDEYENDWREAPSPPEVKGENGTETVIFPQCSDCGLSFDSIQEMMKHRIEDHTTRRSSVDASNTNTGCCPSPVPSSVGSRSLPDSEAEVAGGDSDTAGSGRRRKSTRKLRLSQSGSKSVKERAEAALRELNHPRQRSDKRWLAAVKQKAADIYNFTDESL